MDPLSVTASAIAILQISGTIINLCYDYRRRIKNAAKEASRIVSELNGLRSVIESLFVLLEDEEENSTQPSALDKLAQSDGPLTRCIAELKILEKKLEPKEGWRATKAAILWPLKESDMKKVLHDIDSTRSTVQLALAADQRKATTNIQHDISSLNQQVSDSIASTRRQGILRWLSAASSFSSHAAARKQCQVMTGLWFLNGAEFMQWSSSPKSFLWIYGIPGCGKTILCSSIIDNLSTRCSTIPGEALAYFYFDFNDNEGSRVESLLRSILAQLFTQRTETSPALDKLFDQSHEGANQLSLKDLIMLLSKMFEDFDQVYLVIDALDECSDLEEMLQILYEIHQWNLKNLHALMTSRQHPEIENVLSKIPVDRFCLQGSGVNDDIALYIAEKLKTDERLVKWSPEIRELISKTLSRRASGMFRWVVCQLDTLRKCLTINTLKKQLQELPKTLDETYDQILLQIDENHRHNALKVLQWLAFAALPVTIEEVAEVLAVDLSMGGCYDADLRLFDPNDIMFLCSALITRVKASAHDESELSWPHNEYYLGLGSEFVNDSHEKVIVRLAHLSVRDYLVSDRIKQSKAYHFAIDGSLANTFIAQTCLVYLLQPQFASGHCNEDGIVRRNIRWPLYRYATHFWPFHVKESGETLNDMTWHLLQRFFNTQRMANGGNFAAWAVALTPDITLRNTISTQPLYYAASFGITPLIRKLLDSRAGIDIDAAGGRFESPPLQVAAYRNHPVAVKLLLEAGADPMVPNSVGESSLFWAIVRGHEEVQIILKRYGATLTEYDLINASRYHISTEGFFS